MFGSLAISLPPNLEVPAYLGSRSRGVANFARLRSLIVDILTEHLLNARNRSELTVASPALDRLLYWQFYFIPVRVLEPQRVVLWDKFGKPELQALYFSGHLVVGFSESLTCQASAGAGLAGGA